MKRFFDRYDEWQEQFNIGSENTELNNWHNPDNQPVDSAKVLGAAKEAMLDLKKLPAHLRHSLRVLKDGLNISQGGILSSSAYPYKPSQQEIAEQGQWAGMYFPFKDGKIMVEYKSYGMAPTIVHEVAHAIDFEVLGISGLPGHAYKPTRLGRDFTKLWKANIKNF